MLLIMKFGWQRITDTIYTRQVRQKHHGWFCKNAAGSSFALAFSIGSSNVT